MQIAHDPLPSSSRLQSEIIAEVLGVPAGLRPHVLVRGEKGAPLLDTSVSWQAFRCGMQAAREGDREFADTLNGYGSSRATTSSAV